MATRKQKQTAPENKKLQDLKTNTIDNDGQFMTTNQGLKINDDQNSLKAGERGATLLEDFILREKITHFDHERIPERIVHARGSAAHGVFEVYESMSKYTKAGFLQKPGTKTPVFVRFSTVAGSRGSTDLARDVRGFSVKFYTEEGNYDLVGNNMPVFFIQDAAKFPDLVHAVKPEPHNEIPQAASAHDTFWDFISLMPESMHMIMWVMSDRAIPRSYRMMEGFGVHTFRFINAAGKSCFVKFHWKPKQGVYSLVWDEATVLSGKDPDFHRRDLWEAIEKGAFPEWELGVQIVEEKDEHKFDFDLLDPTKLIPEEIVPVKIIGKMTLNRNPRNFFAETEQVAFHPGHLVPGIDFSNDPLLQGRLFSYTDTQLSRLGGPNFHEIPINRSINPVYNNQRDGIMRQQIDENQVAYHPNSMSGGCPYQAKLAEGGFASHSERIDASKVRARSRSFFDHFSQASLFYKSQSAHFQTHIAKALSFELGKVTIPAIRERMVGLLTRIDSSLALQVAEALGLKVPKGPMQPINHSVPADGKQKDFEPLPKIEMNPSAALDLEQLKIDSIATRQIAVLVADGVDDKTFNAVTSMLIKNGAQFKTIAGKLGEITTRGGKKIKVDQSFLTSCSAMFDGVYIPGTEKSSDTLTTEPAAVQFVEETYNHGKPIALDTLSADFLAATKLAGMLEDQSEELTGYGIIINAEKNVKGVRAAIAQHRFWIRETEPRAMAKTF